MNTMPIVPPLTVSLIAFALGCQSCGGGDARPVSPTEPEDAASPAASAPATTSATTLEAVEAPGASCEEQASQLRAWGHDLAKLGFAFQKPQGFVALSVASGERMGTQTLYAINKDTVWTAGGDEAGLSLDAAERVFRAQIDLFKTVHGGRPDQHMPVPVTVFDATTPWSVVTRWLGVLNDEFDAVALGYLDGRPEVQREGEPRVEEPGSHVIRDHEAPEVPFLAFPMFETCGAQGGDDTGSSGESKFLPYDAHSAEGRTAMVDEAAARFRACDCKVPRAAFEEGLWLDLHGPGVILTVETVTLRHPKARGTTVVSAPGPTRWSEMSPRVLAAEGPIALRVTP